MTVHLQMFSCRELGTKLRREACGERHLRADREVNKRGTPKGSYHLVGNGRCAECQTGAAHARGEEPDAWPDGEPVELSMPHVLEPGSLRWTGPTPARAPRSVPTLPVPSPPPRDREPSARSSGCEPTTTTTGEEMHEGDEQPKGEAEPAEVDEGRVVSVQRGKRTIQLLELDGETLSADAWSHRSDVSGPGITYRVGQGWSVRDAIYLPKGSTKPGRVAGRRVRERGAAHPAPPAPEAPAAEVIRLRPKAAAADVETAAAEASGRPSDALGLLLEEVGAVEDRLVSLKVAANLLAPLAGKPAPFPEASR